MSNWILNYILTLFLGSKFWRNLGTKVIGKLHFDILGYPKFDMECLQTIIDQTSKVNNMDGTYNVYMGSGTHKLSLASILIRWFSGLVGNKTEFTHSWFFYSPEIVMEMVGAGGRLTHIGNIVKQYDKVQIVKIVLEAKDFNEYRKAAELFHEKTHVFTYDWIQTDKNNKDKAYYCSELGLYFFGKDKLKMTKYLGRDRLTPDGIINSGELVFAFYPK